MSIVNENSLKDIKAYLSEGGPEVTNEEFRKFWESLTTAEKLEIKTMPLK